MEKKWLLRGEKDMMVVFRKYKEKLLHRMSLTLEKHQFKMDLVIQVKMIREDREGNTEEVTAFNRRVVEKK